MYESANTRVPIVDFFLRQ